MTDQSAEVEEVSNSAFAEEMGIELPEQQSEETDELLEQLGDRDVDPVVASLLENVVEENRRLRERVEELEDDQEETHDVATTAVGKAQTNEGRVDDLEEQEEKTRDIARSAIAKAEQTNADPDQQEDAETLPQGVEPSTSPLDFFANCRQSKIKTMFVEKSNRQNTYRAVAIAKRWKEFATRRNDGTGVFWTRDDVQSALLAHLGEHPHRMTVTRVWQKLKELGGDDVDVKERSVSTKQDSVEIVSMSIDTAEKLLEKRYIGMDLLEDGGDKATTGGVTPVVTGNDGVTA